MTNWDWSGAAAATATRALPPGGVFRSSDGKWIAIEAGDDKSFARLVGVMGQEWLKWDPRFGGISQRAENGETINHIVEEWAHSQPLAELVEALFVCPIARPVEEVAITLYFMKEE